MLWGTPGLERDSQGEEGPCDHKGGGAQGTESKGAAALGRTRRRPGVQRRPVQTQAGGPARCPRLREEGPLLSRGGAGPTTQAPVTGPAPGWWLAPCMGQTRVRGWPQAKPPATLATSTAGTRAVFKGGGRQRLQQIIG